jgi:hypothetical protein
MAKKTLSFGVNLPGPYRANRIGCARIVAVMTNDNVR